MQGRIQTVATDARKTVNFQKRNLFNLISDRIYGEPSAKENSGTIISKILYWISLFNPKLLQVSYLLFLFLRSIEESLVLFLLVWKFPTFGNLLFYKTLAGFMHTLKNNRAAVRIF